MRKKLKRTLCAVTAAVLLGTVPAEQVSAIGVGIATYDNTAEMNALEELARWLTQLEDNVTSLKNEAAMLFNPGIEAFHDVSDSYGDLMRSVGGVTSAINSASSSVDYLREKFGDPDYWEQCVKSNCDPTAQIDSAYRAVHNAIESAVAMSSEIASMSSETQKQVSEIVQASGNAGSDEGINATLVRISELEALNAQLQSQLILMQQAQSQAMAAWMQEQSNKSKMTGDRNEKFFADPGVEIVTHPVNLDDW